MRGDPERPPSEVERFVGQLLRRLNNYPLPTRLSINDVQGIIRQLARDDIWRYLADDNEPSETMLVAIEYPGGGNILNLKIKVGLSRFQKDELAKDLFQQECRYGWSMKDEDDF